MNYLHRYREAIRKGEIKAGIDMITELDNLIADLNDPQYRYDTKDAYLRIDFIEHCVRMTKSPFYNVPMKLLLWEKAFIEVTFSFKIQSLDTGAWVDRFQEILLLIARKNGKTEFIAALMLTEMIIGNAGADIVCSGTDDGTADLAYQAIDTMRLLIDPKQIDTWRNQKGMTCFANHSHLYKLSDSTRQKEGRNIDMAGIDEVWKLQGDGIYKPIQQSTSTKDNYKIFMFGSEGFVDGFLNKTRKEYTDIIYGEDDTDAAKRKLPWLYTQDSEQEVWETNEQGVSPLWEKSNPSIGKVKKWSYLKDRVDEARKSKSSRAFVLCKDFDFKQNAAEVWLNPEDYKYSGTFDPDAFCGALCLGAVDLAETTDLVSARIMLMRVGDNTKYIIPHYWIPESKLDSSDDKSAGAKYTEWAKAGLLTICEGYDIDTACVADWFAQLYKQYGFRLLVCGYDVKFSKQFIKRMDEYGFDTEIVQQSKQVMFNALRLCETEFQHHQINFNENEMDYWCLGNAAVETDDYANSQLVKQKGQPGKRIDGAVTYVILYEIYRRYRTEFLKNLK